MPTPDKIDQLYDALKADGAVSKSRENFRSYMLASGDQGYKNRKQLYDALKADGAVESATYKEFRDRLGLHAVKPQQPVAKPSSLPQSVQQPQKPQKAKQQPKKAAWKPTPAQQMQFQQTINSAQQTIQNVNERHKNMVEYSKQRMKHPFGQPVELAFGAKNEGALAPFDSKNLVQGRDEYNPKTGKLEPTYITSAGNKYNSRIIANSEQRQIDDTMERELYPIETQLRDAYAERDRLNKLAQERVDELEKSHEELPWYLQLGEYANSDKMPDAGSPMHRWDNDVQYKQYMAALRKNRALITTLEDKKSGKMNEFWHSLGNEITNGYTFSLAGKAQLDDMAALTFAQKHVDAINKKRQKGEALNQEEQAAEAVLKNAEWDNRVQSQYGDEYGAWARAGKMGAVSLDLMMDFALMGGQPLSLAKSIAGGTGKLAKKLVGNAATKGFGKFMVKATGATLGSMVAGAEIANTVGVGRTMSDAAGRYQGDIILDENGDYVFGHFEDDGKGGQKLVKGGDSFIGAVLGAERTAIAENGSEIAGAFLPGGKFLLKGLEKIGLSKIASGLTSLSGRQWYAAYSRALQTAGFNGVPGEALEEYVGTGFDALMGGEEWKSLADKRTHVDIWLGCATMGALLNAPRIVGTGYQMAQYYRYKHNTDKSDRLAEIRLGNEVWEPLRQQIDEATNGQITDVLVNVLDNENLDGEQKKAVAGYAANLQRMRGYSLGRVSSEQRDDEHQPTQRELDEQTLEQSYTQGYGATDIADMQDIKHGMDYQHERVASFADAKLMSLLDGSPMDAIDTIRSNEQLSDEQKQIAIDYVNARNTHNALLQRINDDADVLAEEDRELFKQMQHTDGSLHPAILKEKDSEGNDQQVYIVDGNVQMMPDGSMVDKASSDNIVVVFNPVTRERKQIDPSADTGISSLGEVTTAEDYEAGIEQKRQNYVKTMMDDVNGIIRPEVGQQVVYNGEPITVTSVFSDGGIIASREDGTIIVASHEELQQEADEISYADYLQRNRNEVEQADTNTSIPVTSKEMPQYSLNDDVYLQTEDGEIHGNVIAEENPDGLITIQSEQPIGGRIVNQFTREQLDGMTGNNAVENIPPQVNISGENIPQEPVEAPVTPAEAPAQPTEQPTAEPMPVGEDGEEDWQATTPERAHAYIFNEAGLSRSEGNEFIAAQTQAAQSALVKAKSAQMPRVGTSIKKYNEAKAKRQEKIDEAQRVLDYWQQVRNIQNDIQRVENERRAAEDAVRHDEAVAEAQAEYEARKQAEAERKAVGNENPMPAITEKWNNATKVDGHRDEIMLPDGTPLKGHYVLHESGASSPSHNPETWQKTDGFPMDANDNSVNDRDYERDHDAQEHTQSIARQYDQRALQSVPVVSNDGVVLSGNGRTMAGELAARDNTDGAYVNYLKEYAPKFGFTPEQVEAMQHPRVSFVPDEAMPYTAETFAKFNQQEMKSQNKTEQAVKLGKTVNDDSFKGIVRTINGYDTLGDFYNDAEASLGAVYDLHNAGVVPQAQLAEMVDGVRGQEKLSAVGREFLENMLIGKAFEGDPEVVRMLTAEPAMRQTVITALGEIVDNIALGGDWSLQGELADAVKLCFDARQGGAKYGEIVSTYARQGVLFADPDELQTVADFNNATMLMLADVLNDKRVTLLKTTLQLYNNNARQSAVGQADLFAGGIQSREDILRDVITFINENYGKRKEIEAARAEAVERRKAESVQQDGTPPAVSTDGEATAEPSAEPAPVEAEPVEATEPVEAEPNAVQTALAAAEQETNTEPTEAQKEAGNYKKGHVKIDGYDVTIENPKGSVRRGTDASGKQWEQEMQNTYGYIRGTEGVDGDHIDVFFSEDPSQGDVFVVDQVNKDGSFDEHKVMYGFPDIESARKAYLSNYEDGWQGLGAITPVSKEEFKKWIDSSHRKTKPFAEYSSVKPLGDTQLGEQPTAGYSIEPTTYTNKKGKTTPMHLVTFGRELSKDEIRAGKELAKESRGWWDRVKGGFMMRDEDSAKALAEALSNEEAVQDAQPLSVEDVATVTDQADMKAVDETIKVEQEPQTTPQYDYDREDDVYDKTLTGLRNVLNDRKRGAIPNIKSIENVIRDLRKRAKTIEDGMATAAGETIPQAFDALANLNGRRKAYEQFLVDIRKKMAETERDDALAAHGVKLGDKIMYKGKEATIHDADTKQVTLDTGMAPVLYEVTDWENVELPKPVKEYHGGDRVFSVKHNANKDIFVAHHKDGTVEYTFTDGTKANADDVQDALPEPKKVNVESLMGELNEKGEAKLSDHIEEPQQEESTEQPKQEEKKAKSKWVDDADAERFEELRRRLRQKLGGQLNMGVDPEAFALGVEMSYLMLKHGARKFAEFAKQMIEALGENVRPYLKSFYNGARDLPEMAEYEKELTPYDEVRTFDVMNFDKEGPKDIVATAEHIVREQAVEREAKEATDKLKQERNEQRKETEQEVAANTEALASEAATVASEVESKLPSARSEREVNDLAKSIDDAIDKVNDQLALLGYYEAEPVESDFNEAYGYMRNAEKKAVKNVTELFKTLTKELGISDPVVYDTKGKKQKSVTANIAPAGGDVTMRFMLNRDNGVELYIDFMLEPDYENNRDNLVLKGIMFRPEKNLPNGGRDYLRANNFFPVDVTVPQMLQGIRSVCQEWLPAEDYVAMAQRIAAENAGNQQEKPSKERKSKKKSVSLQEQTIPDLFSGLFSEDELNSKSNDTARTDEAKGSSRQDGAVGSVSADRDRVLDTASTGRADRGETARVSDEAGAVADGERGELPSRGSQGGSTRVDNVASETGQPLSDGGRSIRNGAASDGRGHDNRAAAATSDGVPSQTGAGSTGGRREQLAERRVRATKQPEPKFTRNYLYPEDASEIDNMTPQQRLKANVEALEIVRTLMQEGRQATAEEREVLGRYRGWGGVELGRAYSTSMMRNSFTDRWGAPSEKGKLLTRLADVIDALDPNGERGVLSAINHAALTSYYTPTGIAKVMNRFAELAGFKGGNMLDPSMGNGIFEGTMSKAVQQRTMIHGVELDWLTGQIARNLYPDANVLVTGYQDAGTADNAYDVVMSNIPFGDFSVTDKAWKHDSSPVRKAAQNRIHNYFAVKMLDNTRPGGLCVIMTSNAILDTKGNQIIREYIADNAELLGVVRLPDNTFKGAGTSVVTDVIFLRKYKDDTDRNNKRSDEHYLNNIEKPFLTSGELQLVNPTDGKSYKVAVNGYFTKNKNMMIGDAKAGGQYRADQFGLGSDMSTDELAAAMQKLVEKKIVGDRKGKLFDTHKTVREVKQAVSEAYKGDGSYISNGNIVEQDGLIGIVTSTKNKYGDVNSTFTEMPELKGKANRVRAMLPIRKAMKQVIDWQIQGMKESDLAQARAELQKAYDDFTKKFGRLNTKENDFLTEDIDGYTLRSLEKWKDGKFVGLSDIFTKNTIKPALDLSTAKTPQEAISLSLAEYGEINSAFMEDVLGESWADQCGETLFKEPFTTDSYLTADAYLSGDVKTKLEQAREAAKEDKALERNVKALEAVQPKDIPFDEISIRMGARWIPSEMYTDFMYDMFGINKNDWKGNKSGVEYMPEVDQYVVNVASNELGGEADQWRTSRRSASEVFTAALKDKSLSVFDTIKEDGKEIKILNKEETELLNGKIQDLRTAFEDWLSQNPEREETLMRLYNDKFNRTVLRKFDGSHLRIPGLMGMELRPHQKDAVWMLVNNRGGIVDHIVGAGKTLVMQSAIMEMRRMGIAKKPMIIGLKATCAQIAKEFREAYPAARILAPTEKDFSKENRKKFMSQIALNDYDCVILSHDQYCMLPHTEEVERGVIDEQMAQLDAAIEFLYGQSDKNQLTKKQIKGLEKRKANLEAKLASLLDRKIDREFTFEGLGVDYLFVDECQHFKSLPYVSTYDRVAGLGDKKGSQRAIALLNGVRYLQKMHQGDRGTIFLSGTTISNSLSEIYHLLNYLRPSEMEKLGMTTFDAWAGNYAIHTAELEYGVTNELKEKDRFRSLTNIPELSKMYAEIADVRNDMNLKLPKPKMRSHIVTVPQSDLMTEINAEIVNMVRNKNGHYFGIDSKDTTPWGLLASTLSAKAAINPRLIDDAYEDEGGKIPAVCEQVKKIYDQFNEQKGTQLIFCDTGVSSKGKKYDAYSDIINRLVNDYGIPRNEIADIHIADTDEKRKALFAKVNEGSVRILIGGTKNMGTGVNVQKRIVAMHHVDVPWTPADREQREGRGVRQGNEIARDFNDDNVDVYFYATEGSLDMYKYQLQETKGKLFAQFKSGTIGERTFDEGDAEGDFDPAEVVAMLSGNPVIFEKSKQDKKVEKLRRAKRAYESDWQRRRSRYEELQTKKRNFERLISLNESDVRSLERGGFTPDEQGKYPATVTIGVRGEYSSRRTFDKPKEAGEYLHSLLKQGKKVELSGFGQKANVTLPITDAGLFGKPVAELDSYGGIKYTVEVSDDNTAAGVAYRNLLQKVFSNKKVYERNLEEVNNQLNGADPGENKFPKQAELDKALKEKKRLDDEYKKLSDEKPKADEDTVRYRIREDEPPIKTQKVYKLMRLGKDGKLYPLFIDAAAPTELGVWYNADSPNLDILLKMPSGTYLVDYENGTYTSLEDYAKERREREAYAERQWRRAHEVANEIIDKLNISDDITVYESIDEVPGSAKFSAKRRRAKGWYDPRTNKIVVVLGNHRSPNDVLQTILHEAVAHYGLRKLFGKNFDVFLDNVYKHANKEVRSRIISMASNKGWDIREATEEYLASLAEDTDFDNAESSSWAGHWFNKIKQLFLDMLHHIGLRDHDGVSLTDNELRYILWRSYKNLAEPGHYRNYFSIAEDTVMQSNLHVGNFAEETGQTIEQSTKVAESGLMFRDGDFSPRDRAIARDTYERMVSTGGYQFQEAVQDSMLGLKRLYQSILGKGTRMEDVDGFENAYLAENRMSSVNAAEQHEYYVRYMKPLLKAISDIVGSNNDKRLELTDYMMAKHGLERNVVMAQRDFDTYQQKYPNGTKTLDDFRERDYAGLTALTGEDDVAMAELAAQQMVDTYEQDHDTSELWQLVNDATSATLAKIYNSGLLSKERYEQIQKMFEYYIPLQGWDETTSDEVYGYLTSKNGPLGGSPIKHAKGRSSKADDPIATIALMADDAIRQGNRNKMKQTFLNFVLNHQSDLVSVNDLWLQYNAVMDEWEPVFADIENTDTAADVERKVKAFEERMQQLAESDPDNYKRGRDAQNIPYKVVKYNLKEHQVLVRRNGRTYVLTINGNPRAAQALNGLTNPDVETGGVVGNLMQGAQWLNRNLSAFYTTRNPDFVASNFLRDMLYSNCMTWVKESPKYALRFNKNFGRVNPAHMRILLGKWENGTLDESNYIENLFKQFMLNGGETGYTNIKDIDGHKREIASELKRNGSNARKAWQWLGEQLDLLNGSAENCARFAAFVTSREEGRSIERSIYDAKEISVNFNKKGSGGKMVNATGQTLLGKIGSYVGGGGRLLYVFWNAGVQGATNFARAAKRNPKKATAGAASMFMLGAVIPLLAQAMGGDDDDDKNAYYNLPEYVRRSNIIINAGNQWIAIPLPIEFRAFYGLGELATGVITGNERYSDSELAFQMGSQISQILPLDMLEGGGGINPFVPSIAKPFVEAYIMNKSWTGLPVYKDSPWNKNNPEWTKAYKSANTYLVSGTKWLNEISGGDDYKKGFIDINPAKVEYLLSGMFGGGFTTGDKLVKMGETIFGDREFDWRNMLIANRVVKTGDERTANRKLSNEYFKYKDEYEETKRLLKKYSDEAATNERYKHRLERLQQSEEYLLYDVFDNYQPILKNLHDAKDGADEATLKSIENEENTLRRDMVDLMHAIEDDEKPDINAHVDAMLKREFEAGGRTQKPAGSRIAKRLGGTDSYGSPQNEYGQVYLQMRDYVDLAEDVMLQVALKNAKDSGDTDRAKDIESARRQITEVKKDLTEVPYTLSDGTEITAKDIMQELRDLRKNLLSELGITTNAATQ